jgi:hypothetical protein
MKERDRNAYVSSEFWYSIVLIQWNDGSRNLQLDEYEQTQIWT